jgi:tRNA threonylcarbamoyladenosine biosynthesis protein TsaB
MSLILSLETSTGICSVALHDGGKMIVDRETHIPQSHASQLAIMIDEVKSVAGIEISQLQAVAVASGPGSYTGLRIGTSTAKGLCYALNIPLISIGTLDIMTHQANEANPDQALLCPMIDARRMEVYCQVMDADLNLVHPVEAKVIEAGSFSDILSKNKVLFFGDGAGKCRQAIQHENALFLENIFPTAAMLGTLAYWKFLSKEFEDVVHFEPFYLKDFLIRKPL